MSMADRDGKIWMDGTLVDWRDAKIHVLTHTLHYGCGAFEGVRAYNTVHGTAIFRLQEHTQRLFNSAKILRMKIPFSFEEVFEAQRTVVRENKLESCYLRPLTWIGSEKLGVSPKGNTVHLMVAAWPWGAYLGEESKNGGIRAAVSSWRRISPAGSIPHAKASGSYLNSILAKTESANAGYEEAILLDERGFVCEGSGENIFLVRDGEIVTPPHVASILDGINRKSVIQIARDLGYTVIERDVARAELYLAEEVFLTGTAAELVPVREIDDHDLGGPGEITLAIQAKYEDALHGRAEEYLEWLDPVGEPTGEAPPEPTPDQVEAEEVGEPS